MAKLTPMMQQYIKTKEEYKDCILFYRLGDFYEMFFDDAITASRELEITLTGKNCGLEDRAPMCGVPFHAYENYLNRLVEKGYKVAICEQVEDPKTAKGIVKREVIRVVTPGTKLSESTLEEKKHNYIMCVFCENPKFGIAVCDVTTGEFLTTQLDSLSMLLDEINKFMPAEIICNEAFLICGADLNQIREKVGALVNQISSYHFQEEECEEILKRQYKLLNIKGLGISEYPLGLLACGALLSYLHETQKNELKHLSLVRPYSMSEYMRIDTATRRNLELCETMREKKKKGSLLWVLDKTKTAMGARLLRTYVEQPLLKKDQIEKRLSAVETFYNDIMLREELREYLNSIYDLERLTTKISYGTANPRDLIAFKNSLKLLPTIKELLATAEDSLLCECFDELDELRDLYKMLEETIVEEPPVQITEGGIIKNGYSKELDKLKAAKTEGKTWLADLESKEREKTGIKNLKIKYNKVFHYYFEVTNSYKNLVPNYFIRKQTLTNAERYTTEELENIAEIILNSEDKLYELEYEIFIKLRNDISSEMERIKQTAHAVAKIDVFCSLATVAANNNYVRPKINKTGVISIREGRHPVIEKMISNDSFIANDVYLDQKKHKISIITGPNMAGKSTYMRQIALIVHMAQMGAFVPAAEANIGIVDRIFTRVGASDDLSSGQSTFMVEMNEVANILRNATKNSLLILDEIGRGTSTFDGLSIAWAVVEYISDKKLLGAKTLFATHYHELMELEGKIPDVNNYCISVKEQGDDIVFLRKIIPGGADKSYGIQVARLAGVPQQVIDRAKEIAKTLNEEDIVGKVRNISKTEEKKKAKEKEEPKQLNFFDELKKNKEESDVIKEMREVDLSNTTPMQALHLLYAWQEKLKK
ncbi:MAG: DNA mismatch repair protein MutS [Lachnospiraceae bacterium]